MTNKKNSFLKDSFITLVRQVTSIIIGTLLIIILARVLGPELQGQYSMIIIFPAMLAMFTNFGLNISTVYYVSKEEVTLKDAFYSNFLVGISLSFLAIVAGAIYISFFGELSFKDVDLNYFYFILLVVPIMLLNTFFQTIFQGIQDFKVFNTILVITQITNLIFVVILVVFQDFGLMGALYSFLIGHFVTFLFILSLFLRKYKINIRKARLDYPYLKKSFRYGFKSYLSNLVTFLNYRLDIYLVGFFVNPYAVGLYVTAVNIGEKLSVFTQSISTVLLPKIASMSTEEERNQLTALVSRFTLLFMIFFGLAVFLGTDFIVGILGDNYEKSSLFLKILLPGISLLAVEKVLSNDIAARGRPEINMYVSIFNVVFSTILNIILIPKYGAVGAAVTTTLTYSLSFFIKSFLFGKITGEVWSNFLVIKKQDVQLVKKIIKRQSFVKKLLRS